MSFIAEARQELTTHNSCLHCLSPPAYTNVTVVVAPGLTSAVCFNVPNRSCQAEMVCLPAGTPLMVNDPSPPLTAKYGWLTTPTYAAIQRCTSHLSFRISSSFKRKSYCVPASG